MEVRLNGKICKARITQDNPPGFHWQLRVFDEDGAVDAVFETREAIEDSGLQIVQYTNGEFRSIGLAGFQPPFLKD